MTQPVPLKAFLKSGSFSPFSRSDFEAMPALSEIEKTSFSLVQS